MTKRDWNRPRRVPRHDPDRAAVNDEAARFLAEHEKDRMSKGRSPFYRNRLRHQERADAGPKGPSQDTGYRKRFETRRPCALCANPKERVFLTRGVNADGTLRVFTFCAAAHLAQWRTINPWETE